MMSAAAGEEFVDLGLPSGLLWAKGNLIKDGTTGEYAIGEKTDWGTYVSWGNIIGHNEGEGYDFSNANYNRTPGYSVAANIPSNDAAHDIALATLGTPWHLPTKEDFKELYDNTDSEWVADYNGTGVAGRKFMKKSDHSVYVFFPASGYYNGTSLNYRGSYGNYWSSSFYSATRAYYLYFNSSSVNPQNVDNRRLGFTVRPVTLPFAQLSLHFQDGSGNALAGLAVTVTDGNGAHSMTTDASGNIVMNVVKGNVMLSGGAYSLDITTINVSGDTSAVITGTSVMVDLGLPSGTLWAKGNLVKDANGNYAIGNETDWGTYISWGNIIGHNEGEGYNFDQTTYDGTPGASVAADIPSNDAAHDIALAALGAPLHLPTKEQTKELYDNTDSEWVADYNGTGVAGRKFMKKSDHSVYVFFPASGLYHGTSLSNRGSYGCYWSSSFYSASHAYYLSFSSSPVRPQDYDYRRYGFTVRPVQ